MMTHRGEYYYTVVNQRTGWLTTFCIYLRKTRVQRLFRANVVDGEDFYCRSKKTYRWIAYNNTDTKFGWVEETVGLWWWLLWWW